MKIVLGAPQQRLFELLRQAGITPAYLVGGYVRNQLLGLPEGDMDIASPFPPQVLAKIKAPEIELLERSYGLGTVVVKQRFGGETYPYEYTAFRCDNYGRGGAHVPQNVAFTKDIKKDAQRRDFTVNALYADETGSVLDPTGRGLLALAEKQVAQVRKDTLAEDALRILRMVRFACELGFTIEEGTYACAKKYAYQLKDISKERIRDEFTKILLSDAAQCSSGAVLKGLHLLKDLGALRFIFPRLLDGDGVQQSAAYHAYDVLEHSMRTCACTPPDLVTRLAGLLHDVGKPEAKKRGGRMYGHERLGAAMAEEELRQLRFEKTTRATVAELVENHMFDLSNEAHTKAVARMIAKLGKRQFLRLCDLREADFAGSGKGNPADSAHKWRAVLEELLKQQAPIDRKNLAVNGEDLQKELGIPQGKRIGMLLSKLHEYAVKKPSQNNYKSLIRYAKIVNARNGAADGEKEGCP